MFGPAWTLPWALPEKVLEWLQKLASVLDPRMQGRFIALFVGMLFATGRRSVARWLAVLGAAEHWSLFYYLLSSLGGKIRGLVRQWLVILISELLRGKQVLLVVDDTVLRRYGPKVQGGCIHRNPSPQPGEGAFCYGCSWVTVACVLRHPLYGPVCIPIGSKLQVSREGMGKMPPYWGFQTKPQLALEQVLEVAEELQKQGIPVMVVQDGAYTHREYVRRLRAAGLVVIGRLRSDAALWDLPPPREPGQQGRPRLYGTKRISLAKRAGHPKGWQ